MKEYLVRVIITELRDVTVQAETKAEARQKARGASWVDASDAIDHEVRVKGKVEEL